MLTRAYGLEFKLDAAPHSVTVEYNIHDMDIYIYIYRYIRP